MCAPSFSFKGPLCRRYTVSARGVNTMLGNSRRYGTDVVRLGSGVRGLFGLSGSRGGDRCLVSRFVGRVAR